ncbi:MAG: 8-amino-7-oxononanoate synthase [Spongiibacter sp.]
MEKNLQARLAERQRQSRYRQRRLISSAQGPEIRVGGKLLLQFCSNDYLGHAAHPALGEAMCAATASHGVGSGASHLVCGHSDLHHQLELRLAELTGRDRALLFSTGYMANLGIIAALLGRGDQVLEDRLNHASLLDGGLLSGARFQRFRHNDLADLESRLAALPDKGERLVVVDAVYSMDGDQAPLVELAETSARYSAWLMADDAHGFGVLGAQGGGSAQHFQLGQQELPILMGTLGKAVGSFGAFVAGSETLIESLIQFARPYIYTTAMPAAVAAATLASLDLMASESWRRERLHRLIQSFRERAAAAGLPLMPSVSPIQPLLVGDEDLAMSISAALEERGVLISAIRPPTVPPGSSRLRLTLTAAHSDSQVDRLLDTLVDVFRRVAPELLFRQSSSDVRVDDQ